MMGKALMRKGSQMLEKSLQAVALTVAGLVIYNFIVAPALSSYIRSSNGDS